jgi:hypothetical protein
MEMRKGEGREGREGSCLGCLKVGVGFYLHFIWAFVFLATSHVLLNIRRLRMKPKV